jgi:hypothetical protein
VTLYECANCGGITNTVWSWAGSNLCRTCFGIQKLGAHGADGIHHESALRLVRGDGTMIEIDTLTGTPVRKQTVAKTDGARPVRKIRLIVSEEK